MRIVLEGLKGESSIAELCRKEGINPNVYYSWSKDFLEAGKKRLNGDTAREATSNEVSDLRKENSQLKELVAEISLKNRILKKSLHGTKVRVGGCMRYSQSEKMEIIRIVEESSLSVRRTLEELDINRSSFYKWFRN